MEINYEEYLHIKFPDFLKDFLNKFVNTKFYVKSLKERKEIYGEEHPDYLFVDWQCLDLQPYINYSDEEKINGLLRIGEFGLIPHYQHDEKKTIVINFIEKKAWLMRGFATEPYAKYILQHKQEIPRYMKPLIKELFDNYDKYKKIRRRNNG